MARGQKRTIEEKIAEKEELIASFRTRLKSEQSELDALYKEKKNRDLDSLNQLLEAAGLDIGEAADILQDYVKRGQS
ncbi:MAG: hypothetical protein NC400_12955 [Clostridium sp.]|nr:hypothetical protein [Clostridium sp.]